MDPRTLRALLAAAGLVALLAVFAVADRLRRAVAPATTPVQRLLANAHGDPLADAGTAERLAALAAENALLRARLADLRSFGAGIGTAEAPQRLRGIARGRIIARTLRAGRRYVELDVGASDHVEIGLAVVAGSGGPGAPAASLIGIVVGLDDRGCLVQLTTDNESRLPAELIDPGRPGDAPLIAGGVAAGTGRSDRLRVDLVEDRDGLNVSPGMAVLTAPGPGRIPAGLVLGVVTDATRPGSGAQAPAGGDHWRITLAPLRTAEQSESLYIVVGEPGIPGPLPAPRTTPSARPASSPPAKPASSAALIDEPAQG